MNITRNIRSVSPEVLEMSKLWPMINALMAGTQAMREAGELFLPRFSSEMLDDYKLRLSCAVLHPIYSRTCRVMAAKPFSKEPVITGYSERVMEWLSNCDMEGTNFHSFAQICALNALSYGIECIQVEYTSVEGVKTLAEEKLTGARPYFIRWPLSSILGWKYDKRNGKLIQIRLLEKIKAPDGDYFEKTIEQVRVLSLGHWETWRKDARDEWLIHESGVSTIGVIPIVFFYGVRYAYGCGKPLMPDLAFQNIEHWQSCSDQQMILHVARCPILFAKGFNDGDEIRIGASTACYSSNTESALAYVEHSGASIDAGRTSILDLEDRMRRTGAEVLTAQTHNKTATEAAIDSNAQRSIMSFFAESVEDGLEQLLNLMAQWVGEPTGKIEVFKDFGYVAENK